MNSQKIKVIYILGSSRSGSTIIDTILGNHESIESVGELMNALFVWNNNIEFCACGKKVQQCNFWKMVLDIFLKHSKSSEPIQSFLSLQNSFERYRRFPSIYFARKLSNKFLSYSSEVESLYRSISKASGKSIIVDSSKNPVRALSLCHMNNIDLYLIHLIRDGRGVVCSLKKSYHKNIQKGIQQDLKSKNTLTSSINWVITNYLADLTLNKFPSIHQMKLRYEDFIINPTLSLKHISSFVDIDFTELISTIEQNRYFSFGHTISGNRIRMKGKIKLQQSESLNNNLSLIDKIIFWTVASSTAKRYGYKKNI